LNLDRKLVDAAQAGRLDECAELLSAGACPDAYCVGKHSPLSYAIQSQHAGLRDLLIKCGANVNVSGAQRLTPLMLAAGAGDLESCRVLLKAGASCDFENDRGERVLSHAARYGQAAACELLLDHGADINYCGCGTFGRSALVNAVELGCHDTFSLLIGRGAAVGEDEVVSAATCNQPEMLERLIGAADPAQGDLLARALAGAVRGGFVNLCRALMESVACPNMDNFVVAARKGELAMCAFLIEQGLHPNARATCGSTPLHAAAEGNCVDVARLLIANGADVNVESGKPGWTPLYEAIRRHGLKDSEIVRLLLANGADTNPVCESSTGFTPFQFAVRSGLVGAVRVLAEECDEDLDQRTFAGHTMEEVAGIWTEVVDVLRSVAAERAINEAVAGEGGVSALSQRPSAMSPL
jgi:ankyrin repeat protein